MTKLPLAMRARMSEKAYGTAELNNTYTFDVPTDASKDQVKQAVETLYKVKVTSVNVANLSGKYKRSYRRRGQRALGQRNTIRKAYVRLAGDDKLPIFEAVAAAEEKAEKAAAKAAKKSVTKRGSKESS